MPLCLFPSTTLFPSTELFPYCIQLNAIKFTLIVDASSVDILVDKHTFDISLE